MDNRRPSDLSYPDLAQPKDWNTESGLNGHSDFTVEQNSVSWDGTSVVDSSPAREETGS